MDTSFDRHATVDKITKRVEFVYTPTYQMVRKMILKALKLQAKRI
jgi:tetrahydromethanopterin S-methyltransferase subunit G